MARIVAADKENMTEIRLADGGLVISIPITIRHRSGRKEIIMPTEDGPQKTSSENEALLLALIRAYTWTDLIESGQYSTVTELAEAVGFDRSYVGRILSLVNLAPDIVEAVLDGKEPREMSILKLRRGIPESWEEQRKTFCFVVQDASYQSH